jgi:fatty-acyl-CoA synthase
MEIEGDQDNALPHDGTTFGRLKVKGPFIVGEYFKGDGGQILDRNGFFDTGDVATFDEHGFMQITDRTKDLIKSGGEWISSVDLENALMGHPAVREAAVIAVPHPRWLERPLAVVVLRDGASATPEQLREHLAAKFSNWQLPDAIIFVPEIPRTSVGKVQKSRLRETFAGWEWKQSGAGV